MADALDSNVRDAALGFSESAIVRTTGRRGGRGGSRGYFKVEPRPLVPAVESLGRGREFGRSHLGERIVVHNGAGRSGFTFDDKARGRVIVLPAVDAS